MALENTFVQDLIRAYTNEYNTEILLPYQYKIIEQIVPILRSQKNYIEEWTRNTPSDEINKAVSSIYQLDYERMCYFLTMYLKTRLKKINLFGKFIIDETNLSESESKYLRNISIFERKKVQPTEKDKTNINGMEMNEFVGFYVLCDRKSIIIDGNILEIRNGDIFVCMISEIYDLLINNEIFIL